MPDVSPVLRGIVRPAPQHPDPVPVDDRREPDPRVPRRRVRYVGPMDAVVRAPDVVTRVVFGDVVPTAEDPDLPVVDDRRVVSPGAPSGVLRRQLPLLAIGRMPDVVLEALLIPKVIVLGPPEDPHLPLEDDRPRGDS